MSNDPEKQGVSSSVSASAIERYFNDPKNNRERLEKQNSSVGEMMNEKCVAAVVVPAHNEAANIEAFLKSVNEQRFSPGSGIDYENFEIIICDNNSSDGTADIAKKWLEDHRDQVHFKIHVVTENFPQTEKGVGPARKLGADLALLRAHKREGGDTGEFYVLGLDSDNSSIPQDHLEKYLKVFREKSVDVVGGRGIPDTSEMDDNSIIKRVSDFAETYRSLRITKEMKPRTITPGFNHGLTRELYLKLGGYPKLEAGEDTFIWREALKLGAKYEQVDSIIRFNPRRVKLNPYFFGTNQAWQKEDFTGANAAIREGESNEAALTNEHIREIFTRFVAEIGEDRAGVSTLDIATSVSKEIDAFNKFGEGKLDKEWLLTEGPYSIIDLRNLTPIRELSKEGKEKFLKENLSYLQKLIGDTKAFVFGQVAQWIHLPESPLPDLPIPSLAIPEDGLVLLKKNMEAEGYKLFRLGSWSDEVQILKAEERASPDLIGQRRIVFLKTNTLGNSDIEPGSLSVISLAVLGNGNDFYKLNPGDITGIPNEVGVSEVLGFPLRVCGKAAIMAALSYSRGTTGSLEDIYKISNEEEKALFRQFILRKVDTYTQMMISSVNSISKLPVTERESKISALVENITVEPERFIEEAERKSIGRLFLDVVNATTEADRIWKIRSAVIDRSVPQFLKEDLVGQAVIHSSGVLVPKPN